ncbi:MAG: aminodeoxychorismate synthase component I [Phyllobacteriaceae bacterium]|nr:aminodeoxychorismate synthase component I [Phyllobacteriaceae bacterium]
MRFGAPQRLLAAHTLDELETVFTEAETARRGGRWVAGYFAYEAGALFEPKLAVSLLENRRVPLAVLGVFDAPEFVEGIEPPVRRGRPALDDAKAHWSQAEYAERFARLHDHLRKGDCYQANLTFPIFARWSGEPMAIFDDLAARQPVKHSAYVNLGATKILSRSPELFFRVDRQGWIESLPMKGTAKRGATQAEDRRQIEFLKNDPKNQSENRMIVDLLRNDISRVSEVGTLSVPRLFEVETYRTLHQMVSLVRAKLLPERALRDIFAALFPCGSITGAPKLSAMTILQKLEQRPRDVYCGSIGWAAPDGTMQFNVAIRTLTLFSDGEAVFNVGGGVVFDSTPESEYAECLLKARFALGDRTPST